MDFTRFKLRRTKKYSFNHIKVHCITYSKLVYPYIENDVLILDYYRLNWLSKGLMKSYTVKVYKNNTWEIDGVKQTRKPKIRELKAYVISNTELGYYLIKAFISKVVDEFINNNHYSGTLNNLIKFLTKKKAKAYIPEYLQQKCEPLLKEWTDYVYNEGDFIYKHYRQGLIITKDHKVYNFDFNSFTLTPPKCIYLKINSGVYEKLNLLHLCINNKNINEILYLLENNLSNLINKVDDKRKMQIIKKLSLSKKQILNKYNVYLYSPFWYINNLNSYRDEDFNIIVHCFSYNFPNVLEKYKNYKKYFDYYPKVTCHLENSYFYSCGDYFRMLINNENTIPTNMFPKYPAPEQIEHYHNRLVEYIRNLKDQEKMQRIKALNKTYDLLKPQLKKLEYSNDKYSIIIPEQLEDLIKEGDVLHHCVGSYVDAVINKRNKIYFLRKNTELTKPYFTIDVDYSNTVRQVHTYCNKNVSDVPEHMELVSFIKSWSEDKNLILSNFDNVRCAL
jgi:hypothetical protein